MDVNGVAGKAIILKVYSPAVGNLTTYGLTVTREQRKYEAPRRH